MLDFPEKIAATVFTGGCNLRCPFCHNASLVLNKGDTQHIAEDAFFEFLNKRKNILDGVCISGGEPLLHKDLKEFILKIKALGFSVKLDTNGCFPTKLKELVNEGLVDYIAMDIKNAPAKYQKTAGITEDILAEINESVAFLLTGHIDYEFRTTVVDGFHAEEDFVTIGKWIRGAKKYYLQNFVDSGDLLQPGLQGVESAVLNTFEDIVRKDVPSVKIR
jgi:pyruvate formate lyase activating enzyme